LKKTILTILVLVIVMSLTASDFRDANWGMSRSQVKKTEKAKFFASEKDLVFYKGTIIGLNTFITYGFSNNKLINGGYLISGKHTNQNDYIDDYKKIQKALKEKYGNPRYDKVYWKNKLYKDNVEDYGLAISIGHLIYEAVWDLDNTEILLQLSGDNYKISLLVKYTSKNIKVKKEPDKL